MVTKLDSRTKIVNIDAYSVIKPLWSCLINPEGVFDKQLVAIDLNMTPPNSTP